MTPELKPGRVETSEQFAPREVFNQRSDEFVGLLEQFEVGGVTEEQIEEWWQEVKAEFSVPERALFSSAWELFRRKHCLGGYSQEEKDFLEKGGRAELVVELGGPLAVGKSTVAKALAPEIGAKLMTEVFAPGENPFLAVAYQNPDLMTRTQWGFLLASLEDSLRARFFDGRLVRDNSFRSDALVFMKWRQLKGIVTDEEFQTYMRLYNLLTPSIPTPDLLLMLKPNSLESLKEGWRLRLKAEPQERGMEVGLTDEDFAVLYQATNEAIKILEQEPGLKILALEIDPVEIFRDGDLRYNTVHKTREELGILGELITPSPEEACHQILDFFHFHQGRFENLDSPSMFAGKTTTIKMLFREVNGHMLIFRPAISMRWKEETEDTSRTRDGDTLPVVTLKTNGIEEMVSYISKEGITPRDVPILAVDEAMLLVANANQPEVVIRNIKWLRDLGFNVLFAGLSTSFKGEHFNFMDVIRYWTEIDPEARSLEMTTRCKYCSERAAVSRLTSQGNLVSYYIDGTTFPGDAEYEPVCGTNHPSCADRPEPFVKNLMPRTKEEYEAILERAGVKI
jgi:deoxyadenosine/deoxycytidine kinase/thymidine kinase